MADENAHGLCPACGAEVAIDPAVPVAQCADCGHQFFVESPNEDADAEAETVAIPPTDDRELDALRIRQRLTIVRSAYRSRSYAIMAMVVCAVLVVQSIVSTANRLRMRSYPLAALYVLFGVIGVFGTIYFFRKAMLFHNEARKPALHDPDAPPDFADLGDGSQRVRNLEEIR